MSGMSLLIEVQTTTATRDDAERIAQELVQQQLAACVHVLGPITSTYRWHGAIETAEEWICVAKTRADLYHLVEREMQRLHKYETPQVLALPIQGAAAAYRQWVEQETISPATVPVVRLFRVIVPVGNIEQATKFYSQLFTQPGERVSPGRHYFHCAGVILACYDARADGDSKSPPANPEHIYLAVADLEAMFTRAGGAGCKQLDRSIETRPWGERSFYLQDPFGNPLCFVDEQTVFTG
jgi:uncharacterized protein involved in tolerance to divalent cations/uncharacterized glyoxalase superfamily protein PhnB